MFSYSKLYKLGQLIIIFVLIACQPTTDNPNDDFSPEITNTPLSTPVAIVTPIPNNSLVPPSIEPTLITPITQTVIPTLTPQYPKEKAVLYEDFNKIYLSNFIDEDRFIAEGSLLIRNPQAVSPDQTKVIMQTEDKQDAVLNLETHEVSFLSSWGVNGLYGEYVWSHNNSKLGYISLVDDSNGYYLNYYHLETKAIKQHSLSDEAQIAFLWGWSFDDRYFALQMIINGQSDLYIFDNLTESLIQMTNTPDVELYVSWSPNSQELLIGSNSDPNVFNNTTYPYESETLFIIDIDKKQEVLLESLDVTTFAWHPSATKIAYSYNLGTLCFLTIASKETKCPEFEEFPLEDYSFSFSTIPVWSQDGEWLLLAIEKVECGMIYALNPETGEVLRPKTRKNCLSGGGVHYWVSQ